MAVTAINDHLEVLYRAVGPTLWRSLLAYSGDPEIASDAVAEAFSQAIFRGDEVRSPEPWIWKAAFRIAAGELSPRWLRGTGRGADAQPPGRFRRGLA